MIYPLWDERYGYTQCAGLGSHTTPWWSLGRIFKIDCCNLPCLLRSPDSLVLPPTKRQFAMAFRRWRLFTRVRKIPRPWRPASFIWKWLMIACLSFATCLSRSLRSSRLHLSNDMENRLLSSLPIAKFLMKSGFQMQANKFSFGFLKWFKKRRPAMGCLVLIDR